jgi:hypothetical protein
MWENVRGFNIMGTRQQRRAMARKLAKSSNVQAAINKLDANSEQFAKAATKEWIDIEKPKIIAEVQGQMFTLFLGYMKMKYGFGKDRLTKLAYGLNEFCDDMKMLKVPMQEVMDMIESETATRKVTGLDINKLYKELENDSERRLRQRQVAFR